MLPPFLSQTICALRRSQGGWLRGIIHQSSALPGLAEVESDEPGASLSALELSVLCEPRSLSALSAKYVAVLPGHDAVRRDQF